MSYGSKNSFTVRRFVASIPSFPRSRKQHAATMRQVRRLRRPHLSWLELAAHKDSVRQIDLADSLGCQIAKFVSSLRLRSRRVFCFLDFGGERAILHVKWAWFGPGRFIVSRSKHTANDERPIAERGGGLWPK